MLPPDSVPPSEWLNDNPGAVQAGVGVVLTLTLGAVLWYACETRKLAKEAREQRYAACFPLVDAVFPGFLDLDSSEGLDEALAAGAGECPEVRRAYVQNFGLGPALDVEFYIKGPGMQLRLWKVGALAVGQVSPDPSDTKRGLLIWLEPIEGTGESRILRIRYRDVYGRQIESTRRVTADRDERRLRTEPLEIVIRGNS